MKLDKRLNSTYTSNQVSTIIKYETGDKEVHSTNKKDNIKYINNLKNWGKIYSDIINEIVNYAQNTNYDIENFKCKIIQILKKMWIKCDGLCVGPFTIITPIIIPKNTVLYRCVDSSNHCYANPYGGGNYERLTDPEFPRKRHTFYLSFDKNVAKEEAINNNVLIKYKTIKEIKAGIIPNRFPIIKEEDKFFEKRLRKLCNLIFSLTTENNSFRLIKDQVRLNDGIYITTNKLFDIFNSDPDMEVFIYPSTKVKENSELGNISKDKHFSPNKENANIAIFNDLQFDKNDTPYSKYVKVTKITAK